MNPTEIEKVLREAPKPQPAVHLKERLRAAVRAAPNTEMVAEQPGFRRGPGEWLRRWWPALAPAALSLACAALFTAQQSEIRKLEQSAAPEAPAAAVSPENSGLGTGAVTPAQQGALDQESEIARLRAEAARLSADVANLERIKADNQKLKEQIAAGAKSVFTPQEISDLEAAKEKALNIQCINNLKQLGLASRVWANDNAEVTPALLLDMTNEMSTPKILVCPADAGRQAAPDWGSFSAGNCSYEYLAPSASTAEPSRVLFRCPVHGTIGLVDGSVHAAVGKNHPDWLFQNNGKLYMRSESTTPVGVPHQQP